MTPLTRRTSLAALAAVLSPSARSQADKPLTILLPFQPGGPSEPILRPLAMMLQQALHRPVVIDPRPGANGLIGTRLLLNAPADGSTILYHLTGLVQNLALQKEGDKLYDLSQLRPLALIGRMPVVLVVAESSPYRTLQELGRAAVERKDLSYGSYGSGSTAHILGEVLRAALKADMPHVAFKGATPLVVEMLAGRVTTAFVALSTAMQHRSGLRPLAVAAPERMAVLAEVPTFREMGYADLDRTGWWGLFIKAGTPQAQLLALETQIRAALRTPAMLERLRDNGIEPSDESPAQIARSMQEDLAYWTRLVQKLDIRA